MGAAAPTSFDAGANNVFSILPATKLQAARNAHAPGGFASVQVFAACFKAKNGYEPYLPCVRDIVPPLEKGRPDRQLRKYALLAIWPEGRLTLRSC